jgi:transposase-like protein
MSGAARVFTAEFRIEVARRIVSGEAISALSGELKIKRSVLYRWRDAYREEGEAGLKRAAGRPPGASKTASPSTSPLQRAQQRIAELERKVGQKEMENDFLKRAFKRVEELRRNSGATASTPKSGN